MMKGTGSLNGASKLMVWVGSLLVAVATTYLVLFAVGQTNQVGCLGVIRVLGAGGLIACASFAGGSFFGFLFCIPRNAGPTRGVERPWSVNTNLVEISDWLTKMLVGVSLTVLFKIPSVLARFGEYFGSVLGSAAVAVLLLCHFAVAGFLCSYLITRLVLQQAFHHADQPPQTKSDTLPLSEQDILPDSPEGRSASGTSVDDTMLPDAEA